MAVICQKILALFQLVDVREKTADQVTKDVKNSMLKRESDLHMQIRVSLRLAKLGPKGRSIFRDKVEDEGSRSDIINVFGTESAYRIFRKMLKEVDEHKAKLRAANRKRAQRYSSSRSGFRPRSRRGSGNQYPRSSSDRRPTRGRGRNSRRGTGSPRQRTPANKDKPKSDE